MEARWLFGLPIERIEVVLHRQSIVHSLVEFVDGSVIAQLGMPDMRTPIAYCLAWPERLPLDLPRLNLAQVGRLDFEQVQPLKYRCLFLALEALKRGGGAPAALNGANEEAVAAYLSGAFPFLRIAAILEQTMVRLDQALACGAETPTARESSALREVRSISDALSADRWGRKQARDLISAAADC
jgi:1-deoxy-D-xylulose-5-phosphate reductoisomerase